MSDRRRRTRLFAAALAAALAVGSPAGLAAHDIPVDVAVQVFVKPEAPRLRLLVRVPLEAMRDVDVPHRAGGLVELSRVDGALRDAAMLWVGDNIEIFEGETRLPAPRLVAARVALLSDRSFESYDQALAGVTGPPLPDDTNLFWNQGLLDILFEYPIRSDRSDLSIHPRLARLGVRVATVLRFLPPGGSVRAFEYSGDPGLVRLDPRWHQAALRFVESGFLHILDGTDHLLFLLCLVIPLRRVRPLLVVVTSFTVAHSITLIAAAHGLGPDALWFPPLIETLIAMSIVYMALENVVRAADNAPSTSGASRTLGAAGIRRRWMITFAFGLVHGFGFSFALRQTLQFAGSHLLTSLLSFNAGVELGQILVLALLVPLLYALFRFVIAERTGTIVLSALVAHTGWHWMIERADRLRQFRVRWPAMDAAFLADAARWLIVLTIVAGLIWLVGVLRDARQGRAEGES